MFMFQVIKNTVDTNILKQTFIRGGVKILEGGAEDFRRGVK